MSNHTVGSFFYVGFCPCTGLTASATSVLQRSSKADCLFAACATNATGWSRSPAFSLEKAALDDNPATKFGADEWNVRWRRRYTPTCYKQVVHLAPLRLLGCVPPILLHRRGECYGK
jgi:hypothetical protein